MDWLFSLDYQGGEARGLVLGDPNLIRRSVAVGHYVRSDHDEQFVIFFHVEYCQPWLDLEPGMAARPGIPLMEYSSLVVISPATTAGSPS